jgi:hypothetical protein
VTVEVGLLLLRKILKSGSGRSVGWLVRRSGVSMIVRMVVLRLRFVDWRTLGCSYVFKEFVPLCRVGDMRRRRK